MNDAKVSLIRSDVVVSEGKQSFLDSIAEKYDLFVSFTDKEPVAIAFAFVDLLGNAQASYYTLSCIDDRNMLYVTRASNAIVHDCANVWDDPNE